MKPNHTPGPWAATTDGRVSKVITVNKGHHWLARVYSTNDPEGEANAALISAAPEILERLERAIQYFHDNGGHESYTWLTWMEEAVAKAKGKKLKPTGDNE